MKYCLYCQNYLNQALGQVVYWHKECRKKGREKFGRAPRKGYQHV